MLPGEINDTSITEYAQTCGILMHDSHKCIVKLILGIKLLLRILKLHITSDNCICAVICLQCIVELGTTLLFFKHLYLHIFTIKMLKICIYEMD